MNRKALVVIDIQNDITKHYRDIIDTMIKRGRTKKSITAILLAICFLLSGCGRKSTFDGSRTSDETGFRMEYSILDKEESVELKLTEDDQIQVHISHTAGNVDVIVGQNGEDPIIQRNRTGKC